MIGFQTFAFYCLALGTGIGFSQMRTYRLRVHRVNGARKFGIDFATVDFEFEQVDSIDALAAGSKRNAQSPQNHR